MVKQTETAEQQAIPVPPPGTLAWVVVDSFRAGASQREALVAVMEEIHAGRIRDGRRPSAEAAKWWERFGNPTRERLDLFAAGIDLGIEAANRENERQRTEAPS